MKNFKKVLAVMTAAATMCISASAFAAVDPNYTGTLTGNLAGIFNYNHENATITLKDDYAANLATALPGGVADDSEVTVLVIDAGVAEDNVSQGDIRYINQATKGTPNATSMGLLLNEGENWLPADANPDYDASTQTSDNKYYKYIVKVGYTVAATEGAVTAGDFAIARGEIVLADVATEPPANIVQLICRWGDLTLEGSIDSEDALAAAYYGAGTAQEATDSSTGEKYVIGTTYGSYRWGDLTLDGSVDSEDALAAAYYGAGKKTVCTSTDGNISHTIEDSVTIEWEKK